VGNASKCAFVHPRNARRVSGVAGRCEKKWRGGALETYVKLQYLANHSASSREFREFPRTSRKPVHLHCLAFHLWVFSLLICSVRLGRSTVGRVLKYVRTQKDP